MFGSLTERIWNWCGMRENLRFEMREMRLLARKKTKEAFKQAVLTFEIIIFILKVVFGNNGIFREKV